MTDKEISGLLATVLSFTSYGIYIAGILKGQVKPHFFTWLIWGLLMSIDAAVKLAANAGTGSYVTVLAAVITMIIAAFAFFHGDKERAKSDWAALIAALAAIPLWLLTDDPLLSVILISAIDAAAFYPTFRKSWLKPEDESISAYALVGVMFVFVIAALDVRNLVTLLYPGTIVTLNILLIAMIAWRRKAA